MSQVPADEPLLNNVTVENAPDATDTTRVEEALLTVMVPLVWLLLNVNCAPIGNVVAFGNVTV